MASLGFDIHSNATGVAADLDKLVVSADKAEKGAKRVGGASKEMAAALGSITAILSNIERHTSTMANGLNQSATAALSLGTASGTVAASLRAMDTVTAKITMDMTGMKTAATSVSAAISQESTVVHGATAALIENTRAANENKAAIASRSAVQGRSSAGLNNFNTINVAAQFQDIGVTAAMGMSPMMIALQQGTQLSAVLGGQGLTGVVRTLGAAFASVFSPVSLLTIGVVALGATGIQALMGLASGTETATDALERHATELDRILTGYGDARDAAQGFFDEAMRRPEDAVASDLLKGKREAIESVHDSLSRLSEEQDRIRASFGDLSYAGDTATLGAIAGLDQLGLSASSTDDELDALVTRLVRMANDDSASEKIRKYATDLLPFVEALVQARGEVGSFESALNNLPNSVTVKLNLEMEGFNQAQSDLLDIMPDFRDRFSKMRDDAEEAYNRQIGSATDQILRLQAGNDYQKVLGGISRAEQEDAAKKAMQGGRSPGERADDQWTSATDNFQQRIDATRLEIETFGQSTEVINRRKAAFDLMNQAAQAGIPITSEVTDAINRMASESASATAELERMSQQQQQIDQINGALASGFANLFTGILDGSQTAEEGISNLLGSLGNLLINQPFQQLFSSGTGGGGFNIGSIISGMFGGARAMGGPVEPGSIYKVNENTPNSEWFMPRTAGTIIPKLPAANQNQANDNGRRGDTHITVNGSGLTQAELTSAIADALDRYDRHQAPVTFQRIQNDPLARG